MKDLGQRERGKMRAAFIMEQHLGHRTYYENLRKFVDPSNQLEANWVEISYYESGSVWERIPFLPARLRGSLEGRSQVRRGLQNQSGVALFNTQVPAVLAGGMIQRQPYVLCTDITPLQYDRMAAEYNHQPDRVGLVSRYKHARNRDTFQRAARLLPWSTWVRESLIEDYGVEAEQIEVIPPGVDLACWQPEPRRGGGPVRILFVGGDFYRKGGALLLEAYRHLAPGRAELVLVTRTPLPVEEGVHVYNHFQPNSSDLVALYQSCDIFVLPSQAEAFGIAAVEASAVGLPVIAAQVGGLVDIVQNGLTGFLIQPGNQLELNRRLYQLVEDVHLRSQLGTAARRHAEDRFDARKNVARIVQILQDVGSNGI